ncbi:MAG: hypothetical protein AB3N14_05085 [Flavobacteriaceae bacterium]
MYTKTKTKKIWQTFMKCFMLMTILGGAVVMISACEKDIEMPKEERQQQDPDGEDPDQEEPKDSVPDTDNEIDSDVLAEYLVLKDASKITGNLPSATDGGLKIDVADTIYLIKGYPLGNRIRFKHDASQTVQGFNIYVGSASYYFDVPKEPNEDYTPPQESDTTSVLVLDLDIPVDEGVDYPFSTEIIIQPNDGAGNPLDEFERVITVEDPEDPNGVCNSIMQPFEGIDTPPRWRWDQTFWEQNGVIIKAWAPNRKQRINTYGWGCCNNATQRSLTINDSPVCSALITDSTATASGNLVEVQLDVDDWVVRLEEYMWFFDNGVFDLQGIEDKRQYFPSLTNFCTAEVGYDLSTQVYGAPTDTPVGTHDFSPGASHINLDLRNWQGPYRLPRSVNIVYTCHVLLLIDEDIEGYDTFIYRYEDYTTALPEFHE